MNVMIGVPAVRNNVSAETLSAIVGMCAVLAARDHAFGIAIVSHADVSVARNLIATEFMNSDCGLFVGIDDDVGIDTRLFGQLLDLDQAMLGAYLPPRHVDLDRFEEAVKRGFTGQRALIEAAPYVGPPLDDPDVLLKPQVFEVPYVPTGFFMVKREVLARILERGLAREVETRQANYTGKLIGFFNNIVSNNGDYLTEDYSFCQRVRDAGFAVMAYGGPGLTHTGTMAFKS